MAQLEEIKGKIDHEEYTAYLSPQEGATSYWICLSGDGYVFTVNHGTSKPDKETIPAWEQLILRLPGWARISTKWEVM